MTMFEISDSNDVFLVQASSREEQDLLEITVQGNGLKRTDIDTHTDGSDSEQDEQLAQELEEKHIERESIQERLTELRERRDELQSPVEGATGYDQTTDTKQGRQTDPNLVDEQKEIIDEIERLENRLETIEQEITALREDGASLRQQRTNLEKHQQQKAAANDEFDKLEDVAPDDGDGVYCWLIKDTTRDQYDISPGDLLLFYRGRKTYRFAAKVSGFVPCSALGSILSPESSTKPRTQFVVLADTVRIQLNSSVIADIAGHDLDYPVDFMRLDTAAKDVLIDDFGGLQPFLSEARKGISERPNVYEDDDLEEWLGGGSTGSATRSAGNDESIPVSDNSPTEQDRTDADSPTGGTESATVEVEDTTSVVERVADTEWEALRETLQKHKLVKLVGPEGTGKRRLIRTLIANWFAENDRVGIEDRVRYTNFYPDLTYGEFVLGGYGESDHQQVDLVTGPLGEFIDLAAAHTKQATPAGEESLPKYLLVIENFDAATPATVLGDLWRALRPANRGNSWDDALQVSVAGAQTELWVPEQFYILGIVDANEQSTSGQANGGNTLFQAYHTSPDIEALWDVYDIERSDIEGSDDLSFTTQSVLAFERLNNRIRTADELGPKYMLGQHFLATQASGLEPMKRGEIRNAWQYGVFSTLASYHEDGLARVGETLLAEYVSSTDRPLSLGQLHSDGDLVEGIVRSLAEDHEQLE